MDIRTIRAAGRSQAGRSRRGMEGGELRRSLSALRSQADRHLLEVGRMVYAVHSGVPIPSADLLPELRAVDALNRRIRDLEAAVSCAGCGAVPRPGDIYCRECGRKL